MKSLLTNFYFFCRNENCYYYPSRANPPRSNKCYFFGSCSHLMLLVILHHSRIHFGIYSSVQEDRYSYHFFLCPKIGYHIVAQLPYTSPSVQYFPTSRYPLERGGMKIKKFVGREFTPLSEMDNGVGLNKNFLEWTRGVLVV